jgi:hydrogenase expression/formation protein HypC
MCLAVPMRLLERADQTGVVEISGARRQVMLTLTPEAQVGDYLIIHAGYALGVLDEEEAERNLELLRELGEPTS